MPIIDGNVRILQTIERHSSDVTTCDFAPNFTLITGSSDKTVRIWEWIVGSGYEERSNSPLRDHKYQVTCVVVSPQGSMLASASVDGTAVLWNLHSCAKLYTMTQVNGDAIRACRFCPDSSILVTGGDNGAICLWDLAHRSLIRTIFDHDGSTQSLCFTPDSQYLISACSLEVLNVWYVQELVDTTIDNCRAVTKIDNALDMGVFSIDISKAIRISEDDPLVKYYKMATSGGINEIKIWTITATTTPKHRKQLHNVTVTLSDIFNGHGSSVTCVRYDSHGTYLVSCGLDKLVKIWNYDGSCVVVLYGHSRYINCVAISKDSSIIASGSKDKQILIWDLNGNLTKDSNLFKHRLPTSSSTENSPEMQMVRNVQDIDNNVKLIEKIEDVADGAINSCCFNGSNLLATGSGDKLVRLFRMIEENNNIEELSYSPIEGHTYAINHVQFSSDGSMLASCSLDGCTFVWNPMTAERILSLPTNTLSIKVCCFSPNGNLLVTAGDDEKATLWDIKTKENIVTLEGHLDAITCACFSPDGLVLATACFNEDFRLWSVEDHKNLHIQENVHETGIQSCDFSPNLEPIPNSLLDVQSYLLATCGNDSLAKLWRITIAKENEEYTLDNMEIKLWRTLQGHGGSITCIRFSPKIGEVVCSTGSDRQVRIWSVYSAECLYVLDHDSIVTTCSFSHDCSLLAVGCLDRTLWLWKLPQQLVFQTVIANKIKCRTKDVIDWTTKDVSRWLNDIGLNSIIVNAYNTALDGQKLMTFSEDEICSGLDIDDKTSEILTKEIKWMKTGKINSFKLKRDDIPYEFLCPITHEIMMEPVTCSDGFSYERNAIAEWFMAGKYTSPMTNEKLVNTEYSYNQDLRNQIRSYLDNNDSE